MIPDSDDSRKCVIENDMENGFITYSSNASRILRKNDIVDHFAEVNYNCRDGYTMIGRKVNFCLYGQWLDPQSECRIMCSPRDIQSPTYFASSHIQEDGEREQLRYGDPAPPGTETSITCRYGYERKSGSEMMSVCENDGQWNPSPTPCQQICGRTETVPNVVIATETNLARVPWNVAIYRRPNGESKFGQVCVGTIVNATVVISAMNCFWDQTENKLFDITEFRVVAGKHFREFESSAGQHTQTQARNITRLLPAGSAGYQNLDGNDAAVLILNRYLTFDPHISPACFGDDDTPELETFDTEVMGNVPEWGHKSFNDLPHSISKLIKLPLAIAIGDGCTSICVDRPEPNFNPFISNTITFCEDYRHGYRVCQGDSGAGLVFARIVNGRRRFFLMGIVSIGSSKNKSFDDVEWVMLTNEAFTILN